jgi:flagellar basal body rod protein FlgC
MNDIMANAVSGMNMSTARFEAAARRIAEKPETDLAQNLVEAKLASFDFKANVAVVKTANEMWKATLDILA